jgi:hypothetical protein
MMWHSWCHQITPAGVLLAREKWRESLKTPIHAPLSFVMSINASSSSSAESTNALQHRFEWL